MRCNIGEPKRSITSSRIGNMECNPVSRNDSVEASITNSERESNLSRCSETSTDFTVIWNNLNYQVDSRRWYTKAKERFFTRRSEIEVENGSLDSSDVNRSRSMEKKTILNHVCGDARSRQLTAIMGPSGAGKSSLLYCLFQNRTAGTTGQILVEGRNRSKLKVCFIPQRDYLNEWLTVREDLIFVSKLKLARVNNLFRDMSSLSNPLNRNSVEESYVKRTGKDCNTSLIDHEANALCVSELLGLSNCLDVPIKNISGGQKKRLSIARELMSKPDILILDEPTTGLDSLTCYKTILVLKDLAQHSPNPMAVIVTIHQPQREVFNLFDKTYFISNTGRVVFDDNPKNVVDTIERVAQVSLPLPNYNPASFLIEIASDEHKGSLIERLSIHQLVNFTKKYDQSYLRTLMKAKTNNYGMQNWKFCTVDDRNSQYSDNPEHSATQHIASSYGRSQNDNKQDLESTALKEVDSSSPVGSSLDSGQYFISHQLSNCLSSHSNNLLQSFRHVFILTHRSWLSLIRNPTFTRTRFAFHALLPLTMLLVFGTNMGSPNNCPKLDNQLTIGDMKKSINEGVVEQNVNEFRFSIENVSFFFILIYGFGINIISSTASFYPLTMHMFKKEKINGLYASAPYFIGQMLAELPIEIFFPSFSIMLAYPLSGQPSSFMYWRMFSTAYVVFLVSYVIHSLGLLSGSIFVNNVNVALLFGQGTLLPMVMLSGIILRYERMSDWMRKLSYTSPFKHGISGIVAARYGFNLCDCDEESLGQDDERIGGMAPNVRHVMDYMFPKGNSSETGLDYNITEVFDKLGDRFVKAQTFNLDMKSCEDVKPYLMHILGVEDFDLFISIGSLILIIVILKLITFSIMNSFPYRTN